MSAVSSYCHISNGYVVVNGGEMNTTSNSGIKDLSKELYTQLQLDHPRFYKMDHLSKIAFLGVEILKKQCPAISTYASDEIALLFSNQYSSEDTDKNFVHSYENGNAPSPALFVYTLPSTMIGEIAIRNKWHGENLFVITPQFDPDLFANYSNILLNKTSKAVLGGWVNVLGEDLDAFFYFAEKKDNEAHAPLNSKQLEHIYNNTTNGKLKRRTEKTDH